MTSLYWKLIGGGVAAILVGVFVASWLARGREIVRLADWQNTVVIATTSATVEPDKKGRRKTLDPDQVPAAIAALKWSYESATGALDSISAKAAHDKAISDKLDTNLASFMSGLEAQSASTAAAIRDLQGRKSTGDAAADCKIMTADSEAAWNGWRN